MANWRNIQEGTIYRWGGRQNQPLQEPWPSWAYRDRGRWDPAQGLLEPGRKSHPLDRSCDKALPHPESRPKQRQRRNSYQILSSHFSSPAGSSQLKSRGKGFRWISLQENGSMGKGSCGLTSAAYKGKDWVVTSQNQNLHPGRRFEDWIGIN